MSLSETKLWKLGITHAVDATNMSVGMRVKGIEYFIIEVEDNEKSDLKQYFEKAFEFIKAAKESVRRIYVSYFNFRTAKS